MNSLRAAIGITSACAISALIGLPLLGLGNAQGVPKTQGFENGVGFSLVVQCQAKEAAKLGLPAGRACIQDVVWSTRGQQVVSFYEGDSELARLAAPDAASGALGTVLTLASGIWFANAVNGRIVSDEAVVITICGHMFPE